MRFRGQVEAAFGPQTQRWWRLGVIVWGLCLAVWLAHLYFALPVERVHVNHERHHYALRVLEFRDLLGAGYWFPQWATHFRKGFGSPYFGFYQPGFFYAASLVPWGIAANHALGVTVMAFAFGGYSAMWLLVRRYWGPLGGWLAASLLLLAPYSATEIYIRGDLAEFSAMMLVPAALLALDAFLRTGRLRAAVGLAFAGAAITVVHASVGLVAHAAFGAVLLWALAERALRFADLACRSHWATNFAFRTLGAGAALGAGVGLAAFYWLPVFAEWRLVSPDGAFTDFYNYANNFVPPSALFDAYRRDTIVPLTLGRMPLVLALVNAALTWRFGTRSQRRYVVGGWLALLVLGFMMSSASHWIWEHVVPLQRLQFPWRLETLATIVVAGLAGGVPSVPWSPLGGPLTRAAIAAPALLFALWCAPTYAAYEPHPKLLVPGAAAALLEENVAPDLRDEWMPKGAQVSATRLASKLPQGQGVSVSGYQLAQGRLQLEVATVTGGSVRLPHYYFPVGWSATLNGQALTLGSDAQGLMQLSLPPNSHGQVQLRFSMTPMRKRGLWISAVSLLGLLAAVVIALRCARRALVSASPLMGVLIALGCSASPRAEAPVTARTTAEAASSSALTAASSASSELVLIAEPTPSTQRGAAPVREREAALELANQGDQILSLNVVDAIDKYQRAVELDSENPLLYWKLGDAYRRIEDFARYAEAMEAAAARDPDAARYPEKLAAARIQLALQGDLQQWQPAFIAATRCLELEPGYPECEHLAAVASAAMGQVDAALVRHRKATASAPEEGRYHLALVSLLYVQQRYAEARKAIEVARRDVPKLQRYKEPLFTLEMISHQVALRMGDVSESINSLETADSYSGDSHPEVAYELGKAYAEASPPRQQGAQRLFKSFIKRVCLGAKRHTFEPQCRDAERRLATRTTP